MELNIARPVAESIVNAIRPFCKAAEVAGSIRRMKDNVKDVEIVAIIEDWTSLFQALLNYGYFIKPGVPDIEPWPPKANAKYLRMMLNCGLKLDLFVANTENWGGLFMMRTGSGVGPNGNALTGFVPGMFARWKKVSGGGRMTGCMPTLPDGRKIVVSTEEEFFKLLGVEWVNPDLRVSKKAVKKIADYVLNVDLWQVI